MFWSFQGGGSCGNCTCPTGECRMRPQAPTTTAGNNWTGTYYPTNTATNSNTILYRSSEPTEAFLKAADRAKRSREALARLVGESFHRPPRGPRRGVRFHVLPKLRAVR